MSTALVLASLMTLAAPETAPAPAPATATATATHEDFIGIEPTGALGFLRLNLGGFGLHYERLIRSHHGLWLGASAVHVHQQAAHTSIHLWTFGGQLAYRYYPKAGRGVFFGVGGGYKRGFGRRGDENVVIDGWSAAPQLGHRWVFSRVPLSVVSRASIGYMPYSVTPTRDTPDAREAARFAQDVLGVSPLGVELELSLSYAF